MSATETQAPPAAGTGPRKLEGRVALVTGGTRGIGAAICHSLAAQGATVAAGYSSDKDSAEKHLDGESRSRAPTGSIHQGNVGVYEDCQRVVKEVIEQHGRLDILVNNAGITNDMPVLKMGADDWNKVISVNLSGAFFMSKPALEHMIERGSGRIVNISSIIGQTGNIGQANYAAAKSGMFGLTTTMAREAAQALAKAGEAARERPQRDRQRGRPGLHRDGHARGRPGEGARGRQEADPVRAPRPPRGDRARRALPVRRRLLLHHGAGVGGQRRDGHVVPAGKS